LCVNNTFNCYNGHYTRVCIEWRSAIHYVLLSNGLSENVSLAYIDLQNDHEIVQFASTIIRFNKDKINCTFACRCNTTN